ncbi:hypothetical protein DVH24_008345 [Malus domestica]|uniref:Uncharacterized protein n=1 Tax=Malus domestica TaxID=3750 RepID=A0A498JLA6_MALDO|nr:hypothetical protein DVH24_008345 [Malus domestica]
MNKDSETASRFLDGLSSLFKSTNADNIDEGEILLVEVVSLHMQLVKVHKVTKVYNRERAREGRKKTGSSSSSFTSELFRSKESSASSGIFRAIFAPSSKDLYYSPVAEKMSLFEQYKVERERPLKVKSYCTR